MVGGGGGGSEGDVTSRGKKGMYVCVRIRYGD